MLRKIFRNIDKRGYSKLHLTFLPPPPLNQEFSNCAVQSPRAPWKQKVAFPESPVGRAPPTPWTPSPPRPQQPGFYVSHILHFTVWDKGSTAKMKFESHEVKLF